MTVIDNRPDYAVEVPKIGFVATANVGNDYIIVDKENTSYSPDLSGADNVLKHIQKKYKDLGMPGIAESARIVVRTVTVTRGDWQPYVPDPDAGHQARYRAN